jgi:hypothetical protein
MLTRLYTRVLQQRGFSSGVKIFDEKERADENYYFSKNDEVLLRRIFESSKDPSAGGLTLPEGQAATAEDKVKLVFMKHGIPASANPELLKDLANLIN